jgi:hypothetical protein
MPTRCAIDFLFKASSMTMRRIAASSASSQDSGCCSNRMFFLILRPESQAMELR